jgi:hypothetical protein
MTEVLLNITDKMEKTLVPWGLMEGEYCVPKRMLLGGVLGGAAVTWIKPSLMFTETGEPRPWSLLDNPAAGPPPTGLPWWFGPIIGAFLLGVLI